MCQFVFQKMVEEQGLEKQFFIDSAATSTEEIWNGIGNPVYPPAREELKKHGISCDGKRAKQLMRADYDKYDYLIGMDRYNVRNIELITGHTGDKIRMLLEFCGTEETIPDPWYTGDFESTYRDIVRGCEALLDYLRKHGEIK